MATFGSVLCPGAKITGGSCSRGRKDWVAFRRGRGRRASIRKPSPGQEELGERFGGQRPREVVPLGHVAAHLLELLRLLLVLHPSATISIPNVCARSMTICTIAVSWTSSPNPATNDLSTLRVSAGSRLRYESEE